MTRHASRRARRRGGRRGLLAREQRHAPRAPRPPCSTRSSRTGARPSALATLAERVTLAPGEDFRVVELARDTGTSHHLVAIRGAEIPAPPRPARSAGRDAARIRPDAPRRRGAAGGGGLDPLRPARRRARLPQRFAGAGGRLRGLPARRSTGGTASTCRSNRYWSTSSSTRRLSARPSGVSFGATGFGFAVADGVEPVLRDPEADQDPLHGLGAFLRELEIVGLRGPLVGVALDPDPDLGVLAQALGDQLEHARGSGLDVGGVGSELDAAQHHATRHRRGDRRGNLVGRRDRSREQRERDSPAGIAPAIARGTPSQDFGDVILIETRAHPEPVSRLPCSRLEASRPPPAGGAPRPWCVRDSCLGRQGVVALEARQTLQDLEGVVARVMARKGPVRLTGLRGAARAVVLAALVREHGERPVLVLVPTAKAGRRTSRTICAPRSASPAKAAACAASRATTPIPTSASPRSRSWSPSGWTCSTAGSRARARERRPPSRPRSWSRWSALAVRVPSREALRARTVHLEVGQTIDRDALVADARRRRLRAHADRRGARRARGARRHPRPLPAAARAARAHRAARRRGRVDPRVRRRQPALPAGAARRGRPAAARDPARPRARDRAHRRSFARWPPTSASPRAPSTS